MKKNTETFISAERADELIAKTNFASRVPEKDEIFDPEDTRTYLKGCDFPQTADYFIPAVLIRQILKNKQVNPEEIIFAEAMAGPARLTREFMKLTGAKLAITHDGSELMLNYVREKIAENEEFKSIALIKSDITNINLPDNIVDFFSCQNSFHQLNSLSRCRAAIVEMIRVTDHGGVVFILDYQRDNSCEFLEDLKKRLMFTKPEIVPLFIDSISACFSKKEIEEILGSIPGIEWNITDHSMPELTSDQQAIVDLDPVLGHKLDCSRLQMRIEIKKL